MSVKRRVAEKALMPVVAAGASAAATYVVKNGPGFVEDKVFPRLKEVAQGAGGVAEKLPEKARAAAGSGGDESSGGGSGSLSAEELSRRSEERARRRTQRRRKATR